METGDSRRNIKLFNFTAETINIYDQSGDAVIFSIPSDGELRLKECDPIDWGIGKFFHTNSDGTATSSVNIPLTTTRWISSIDSESPGYKTWTDVVDENDGIIVSRQVADYIAKYLPNEWRSRNARDFALVFVVGVEPNQVVSKGNVIVGSRALNLHTDPSKEDYGIQHPKDK